MHKELIGKALDESHRELIDWFKEQPDNHWEKGPENRWTSGQHALHLQVTLKMINRALSYPKFLLRYKFGTANRPSRAYEEVCAKYQTKLTENLERAKQFNSSLKEVSMNDKKKILGEVFIESRKLETKVRKLSNKNLDKLILPHPLMGKMTLREIIMWSAYHCEHHLKILKRDYA